MPSFRWSAINGGGDVVRGVMEAPDRAAVVDQLQRQGQIVLRADPANGSRGLAELLQIEFGGARALDMEEALIFETGRFDATGVDIDEPAPFHSRLGPHARQGWGSPSGTSPLELYRS